MRLKEMRDRRIRAATAAATSACAAGREVQP